MTEYLKTAFEQFKQYNIKDYIREKGEQVIEHPELSLSEFRISVCNAIENNFLISLQQYTNPSKIQHYVINLKFSGKGELFHRPVDVEGLQNLEAIEKMMGPCREIEFLKKVYKCDCIHKFPDAELCESDMDLLIVSLLHNLEPQSFILGFIGAQMIFENILFKEKGFYNALVSRMKVLQKQFQ